MRFRGNPKYRLLPGPTGKRRYHGGVRPTIFSNVRPPRVSWGVRASATLKVGPLEFRGDLILDSSAAPDILKQLGSTLRIEGDELVPLSEMEQRLGRHAEVTAWAPRAAERLAQIREHLTRTSTVLKVMVVGGLTLAGFLAPAVGVKALLLILLA